jgi:hypothetical protein
MRYATGMKRTLAFAALAFGSCAPPTPVAQQQGPALELTGRVAGPAERCVTILPQQSLRIAEGNRHILLYGNGRTIWANHLGQCSFATDDVLVTEPVGSSYCRGDIIRSFDRFSRIPGPACVLTDFVPYTRR